MNLQISLDDDIESEEIIELPAWPISHRKNFRKACWSW